MRRLETTPKINSCPYFPERMETQPTPLRSGPRAVGPQPSPNRRPSNQDALEPIGQPRRLALERSTPPESAPPANRGTAQSARPTAVTGRGSVACMGAPARPAGPVAGLVLARPGLDRQTGVEAKPRSTELVTRDKPDRDRLIETV